MSTPPAPRRPSRKLTFPADLRRKLALPPRFAVPAEAAAVVLLAWLLTRGPLAGWPGAGLPAIAALLVGARAGYAAGLAAGGAAAMYALIDAGISPAQAISPLGPRAVLVSMALALGLGALGGLVGDAHRGGLARVRQELDTLQKRFNELQKRHDVIVAAKEAQDRRVVGQFHTLATLYEAAKTLDVLEPAALPPATMQLALDMLEAEAAAVYAVKAGELHLVDAVGNPAGPSGRRAVLSLDGTLAGRAVAGREAVAFDPRSGKAPEAWLAAPLLDKNGQPRFVVVVERLAFLRLGPDALQLMQLLSEWAGRALVTAEEHAAARARQMVDPSTGLHQAGFMLEQLQREWSLAQRYGLALSLLLARMPGLAAAEGEAREQIMAALADALKASFRNVDRVGHYRTADTFLALMPVTPSDKAPITAERLHNALPNIQTAIVGNEQGGTAEEALQLLQERIGLLEALS